MKKASQIIRTIAFTFAFILILSVNLPIAYAAYETDADVQSAPAVLYDEAQTITEAFKAEVLVLINMEREKAGVATLEGMELLSGMADVRAEESSSTFRHTRPDGTRCFTIFKENALRYKAAGENLAFGYSQAGDLVRAWMNSPSHRANILDPDFNFIGIGYFDNGRRAYSSLLFYTPKNEINLTPTAAD